MKESNPLVSIVITSYNRAAWIKQTIESALAQDYENIEIIISDNCSTDNTDEVIKGYLSDQRIRFSKNETNIGMLPNFEKAFFKLAKGDFIINISSDDYLTDNSFISKAMEIINKYDDIVLVFGKYRFLLESTGVQTEPPVPEYYTTEFRTGQEAFLDFAEKPHFGWGGCLLDRNKMVDLGIHFSESFCGDLEINLKLMMYGNIGYVNSDVYTIRMHDKNATVKEYTANQYIQYRLQMFQNAADLYKKAYGFDDAVKKWEDIVLQRDIKHFCHALLVRDKNEWEIFLDYVRLNYPHYYKKLQRSPHFFITSHFLGLFIKNKTLRKLAFLLFPRKKYFEKDYKYVY